MSLRLQTLLPLSPRLILFDVACPVCRRLPLLSLRRIAFRALSLCAAEPTGPTVTASAPSGRASVGAVLEGGGRPESEGVGGRAR